MMNMFVIWYERNGKAAASVRGTVGGRELH